MDHRSSKRSPPRYLLRVSPATGLLRALTLRFRARYNLLATVWLPCTLILGGCARDDGPAGDAKRAASDRAEAVVANAAVAGRDTGDAGNADAAAPPDDLARSLLDGLVGIATGTGECVQLTETGRRRGVSVGDVAPGAAAAPETPRIELVSGLRVVYAVAKEDGDYESAVEVTGADETGFDLRLESGRTGDRIRRRVLREDLDDARCLALNYTGEPAVGGPGLTWLSLSRALLSDLRDAGTVEFGLANESVPPTRRFATFVGPLRRVGTGTFTLMLDDSLVALPSISTRAAVQHGAAVKEFELEFLDDLSLPLLLRGCCERSADHVVRIERRGEHRIARALTETGRAIVYGIQFDVGSADLRADSEPILEEIADVLRSNPEWRLRVDGHTDAIGDAQSNLDLSRRRAETVREDLVRRLGPDAADRVETRGHGEARPRADNETLEGRAANRRVELTRTRP